MSPDEPRTATPDRPGVVRDILLFFWRFSHTSPDESRTSHGLRPSDQANRPPGPCRTMQDEPRMSPDDPELATDLPWFTHGRATDDPEWATDEPRTYRTSHGRATDKPEWATDWHLPRIAPDVLNILKPPGSTPDPPESPRMYKDEPRTCHGPSGTSQGWPRMPPDR